MIDLDAIRARCEAARREVNHLCQGKATWTMSIPVREDDTDVVLTDSFRDIPALVAEVERLQRRYDSLRIRFDATQRVLTRTLNENRVRGECLELAICALKCVKWESPSTTSVITVTTALDKIEQRLAQLEPEEESAPDAMPCGHPRGAVHSDSVTHWCTMCEEEANGGT